MATPIQKEKNKKKYKRRVLIAVVIIYVYIVLAVFHAAAIKAENPRLGFSGAFSNAMTDVFTNPTHMLFSQNYLIWLGIITVVGGVLVYMTLIDKELRKHDNSDTVYGDSRFMTQEDIEEFNMKRNQPFGSKKVDKEQSLILSEDLYIDTDGHKTKRNGNILILGGSGTGKTRNFAAPNILQYKTNMVITDPSGEILRDYGKACENNGYEVLVFNLTDASRSNHYNPFHYIREEKDVLILINTFIKNTTPEGRPSGDPYWEKAERMFLSALFLYLWHMYPEEEQSFYNITKLVNAAKIDENEETYTSKLDLLFEELREIDPENMAIDQYDSYKLAPAKTRSSILSTAASRLDPFKLSDIRHITKSDDFHFETFADRKTAVFIVIPTGDTTFNFLVSMFYSQLFCTLYDYCEQYAGFGSKLVTNTGNVIKVFQAKNKDERKEARDNADSFRKEILEGVITQYNDEKRYWEVLTKKNGIKIGHRGNEKKVNAFIDELKHAKVEKCASSCPNYINLILDEFANIGQIPDFATKIATIRKYKIGCAVILQSKSQLDDIYDKKAKVIESNFDTKIYLGGSDEDTKKYFEELAGKTTKIVENTSYQANGNGSSSYNHVQGPLITADKLDRIPDNVCLVKVRGEMPYLGKKYDVANHKNYKEAQELNDAFEIKSSGPIGRFKGPLSKYLKDNGLSKVSIKESLESVEAATTSEEGQARDEREEATENVMDSSIDEKIMKAENMARKESADKSKEELEELERRQDIDADSMLDMLGEAFGVTENSSKEEIKEAVETTLVLEDAPPDDEISYLLTT